MTIYSLFSSSILGMQAQSRSLNTIGDNVANLTTGGFKRSETRFQTVLSRTLEKQSDLGGIKPYEIQQISKQGTVTGSNRNLDVAINGGGFFIVNPNLDLSGPTLYTRDGSFGIRTQNPVTLPDPTGQTTSTFTTNKGYLADKNEFFVLGWTPETDGTFSNTGTPKPLRVDPNAFASTFKATTLANLGLNLPAGNAIISDHAAVVTAFNAGTQNADLERFSIDVVDSKGARQSVGLNFTKTALNKWLVSATTSQTAVAQVDTVTLAGTIEAGDSYTVTVNGNAVTFNVTGAEANLDVVRDALITSLNNNSSIASSATATAAGTGVITLTAKTAGATFTTGASTTQAAITDNTATAATTTANVANLQTTATTAIPFADFGLAGTKTAGTPNGVTPPTPLALTVSFAGGGTATVSLDISALTQFDADFTPISYDHNGLEAATMLDFTFDSSGHVVGFFSDGTDRRIYKIPLATFPNPDRLEMKNGMTFAQSAESGVARIVAADQSGVAEFIPNARELSNVDLADEFSMMILTQNAYNASATVFRTVDEMTKVAGDMKR